MFINALNLFSWKGRICRWQFLVALIIAVFIFGAFEILSYYMHKPNLTMYALIPLFFLLVSAQIKRLHDISLSGLFALLLFIPMLGELSILTLLFVPGTKGSNKYGAQPGNKNPVNNGKNTITQTNQDFREEKIVKTTSKSPRTKSLIWIIAIVMIIVCISSIIFIFKNTFFKQAVLSHHNNLAKVFLKIGANIDSCFIVDSGNALLWAVNKRETDVIQTLLNWGANVEEGCDSEYTPLMTAINNGDMETTKMLLKAGANPNAEKENNSPLILAAKKLDIEMLKLLQDNGADIKSSRALSSVLESQTNKANSQLEEIVSYLISQKIDIKERNKDALHLAIQMQNTKLVEMLVQAGAKIEADDFRGAIYTKNIKLVEELIKAGANVNENEKSFKESAYAMPTPLYIAIQNKDTKMVNTLLKYGAHINITFPNSHFDKKWTYLMEAAKQDNVDIINLLVKNGAKLNTKNRNNYSAFCIAIKEKSLNAAITLLKHNANSFCTYYDSEEKAWINDIIPLMTAASEGNLELTKLLIARGHRPSNIPENEVIEALQNGYTDVGSYLAKYEDKDLKESRGCAFLAFVLNDISPSDENYPGAISEWRRLRCYRFGYI